MRKLLFLSVFISFSSSGSTINPLIAFKDTTIIFPPLTYWSSSETLAFDEVLKLDSLFKPLATQIPNFMVSDNQHWLSFSLTNHSSKQDLKVVVTYPTLDKLYLVKVVNGTIESVDSMGEAYPFSIRKNEFRNYVFDLNLKTHDTAKYYLKVQSGDQVIVPIKILSSEDIQNQNARENLFAGLYFGIILVMFLYNIFIYISIRDRSYLFYVIYILSVGLTQAALNGYAFQYFWPNNPWIAVRGTQLTGAIVGIVTIFFVRYFLQTKQYAPKFNLLLNIFALIYIISLGFTLFGPLTIAYNLININAGPGSFILLFTGFYIYRKYNNKSALFFSIAWSIFLLSVIVFVLKDIGVIPYNGFTVLGLQIGSAIEVTLLSFALANKINIYRKEKENSQAEALKIAKENEMIIREQNITLEHKVNERTIELKEINTALNNTLSNLKETQSQLVESEKMASLGQLTAGIAHEINNPINFVTSNVKPLKRDVDLLIDLVNKLEIIAKSNKNEEQKAIEIEELKATFDFDYLQEEITYLLKGINEGSTRTAEIVKGLRIFSRVDEDDIKRADINEGLDSTIIIINNLLNGRITIEKNYGNIPLAECYPGKLNQVFLNLITNAIYAVNAQFNNQPGGLIRIETESTGNTIIIRMIDNGIGMNESTLKKLFEPFFTTKPVGEGTGLGLSISYNTIKKHNGTISVTSTPSVGTTFIIEIPIIQPNS
jgi:two-component system, NtrC family, sensor kinase